MAARPRIDLDGVTLCEPDGTGAAVAVIRHRTVEGLVLSMPESADFLVPFDDVVRAELNLKDGTVVFEVTSELASRAHWLGGARVLVGRWTDRMTLTRADATKR